MSPYLLLLIHIGSAVWSVYHVLLFKRDTRAATAWITVCLFVPIAGSIAYYFFGINRVRKRAIGLRRRFFVPDYESGQRKIGYTAGEGTDLMEAGGRITGRAATPGNDVTALYNGDSTYPAMLDSIGQAKRRVLLATYILKFGETGTAFANALASAAARGVEVMVLVDGIGDLYSLRNPLARLRKQQVQVARFLPPKIFPPSIYINLRNHRKLLVVDDTVAFAGGINISDENTTRRGSPRSITDVHFRLRGPVVDELAALFFHDWQFATGAPAVKSISGSDRQQGDMSCRVVADGPDSELDTLALTIETAISAATSSVDIMTPYFLPSREITASLQSAAMRGVKVRIVLPSKCNLFFIKWAHRNSLGELLMWDIEAYYQSAPFCHSKLLCVDDSYCLIGSANLDPRSLRLNFELGIEVFSTELSNELRSHIARVIAASVPVTSADLTNRSVGERLRDSAAALFSPYL
ncbi:MAG: phospholipase D-like domain-containing protein [Proteobacteria bacterium]|nr:phospholipase D-like domain-containing protein [Pseudomonadota bacterium]